MVKSAALPKCKRVFGSFLLAGLLIGCGPDVYNERELMSSPILYSEAKFDPFPNLTAQNVADHTKLFFVTDRQPARDGDPQAHYNNERGYVLRAGVADIDVDPPLSSWEEAREVTLSADRAEELTLTVAGVDEFGVLPFSATQYLENAPTKASMQDAGGQFAKLIDQQLARSANKDIFIYSHGYNVDFDYSTLVSKELQHFLGYQGAFISYNWTATPSMFAYLRDQESVLSTRRYFRSLIEYLAENTRARRIHLIGYSAGSRLAFEAAYQIALKPGPKPKMGHLILISSDLDSSFVLQSFEDGLLDTFEDVTFYQSQTDSALAMSGLLFGRQRIGQASKPGTIPARVVDVLSQIEDFHLIDVTNAEASDAGNGHHYYRSSPWASSDLFYALLTDKKPGERGLVKMGGEPAWHFPDDYPQRLKALAVGP